MGEKMKKAFVVGITGQKDVECLISDFLKVKSKMSWSPKARFEDLTKMMVIKNLDRSQRGLICESFRWNKPNYLNANQFLTKSLRL
jgi:hypothetical protein